MNETKKEGVVTIHHEGELVGIIYNDISTRRKVMYSCSQMTEDEMISVIEGKIEPKVKSHNVGNAGAKVGISEFGGA